MIPADDPLWAEFAAESEEHLDALDRILSSGATSADAINRLFRAMHSLKGMADALGAAGMTRLAHAAEDLLGLVRAGRRPLDDAAGDALQAAVDGLRRQRAALVGGAADQPVPAVMMQRLSALSVDAPPAADPLLAVVAGRMAAVAGRLPGLLASPADAGALRDLAEAAAIAGLAGLGARLAALAEAAGKPAALPALGWLRRTLAVLAETSGEDVGLAHAAADPARLGACLAPVLARLPAALAAPDAEPDIANALAEAAACAAACGDDREDDLLALQDLFARAAEPDARALLPTDGARLAARLGALALVASAPAEADPRLPASFLPFLGPGARDRALAALAAGQGLFRLRLALGTDVAAEAAVASAIGEILASRPLPEAGALDLLVVAPGLAALSAAATAADPARRVVLSVAPAEEEQAARDPVGSASMRVSRDTIDTLIGLEAEVRAAAMAVAEAIDGGGARADLARLGVLGQRLPTGPAREAVALADRLRRFLDLLEGAEQRLGLALRQMDDAVMDLRVLPIGTLFARLPRAVRAVAEAGGKQVDLAIEGEEVTLDRSLVEALADPLLHLARNAVDHGIEPTAGRLAADKPARGTLRISAARRSGQVRLRVSDDGRGIDRDAVLARGVERGLIGPAQAAVATDAEAHALLFAPGFSTAEHITDTSGRGVGLDVVSEAMRRLGGSVEVASAPGQGTSFTLRMPLTAAMTPVLLVLVGGQVCALPAGRVEGVTDDAQGLALIDLATILGLGLGLGLAPQGPGQTVIVSLRGRRVGLSVDRVQRHTDLLLRPLHPALAALPGVGGVGVLGNGEPVLVIEPDGLVTDASGGGLWAGADGKEAGSG